MELKGIVHKIFEVQTLKNDFKKQEIVLKTVRKKDDPYPQYIPITFVKDNIDHLHGIVTGQEITVHINIQGREYNDKFYTTIEGWRIEKGEIPVSAMNDDLDNDNSGLPF